MRLFLLATLIGVLFTGGYQAAATSGALLSDAGYLRKLSFHLRGSQPSPEEYSQLKSLRNETERQEFFNGKINEYLATRDYQERMAFRLSERFEVITPDMPQSVYEKVEEDRKAYANYGAQDSLSEFFRTLAASNLSWDKLLTGKSYTLFSAPWNFGSDSAHDFSFFRRVYSGVLPKDQRSFGARKIPPAPIAVHFAQDDDRIAGVLTTPRFVNRYNTTNINRNRRRAAAVFRIFLCDPMSPSIPPAADKKAAVLDDAFGNDVALTAHTDASEERLSDILKTVPENRHGSDKQCAACHYKLDPMGKTFQNTGIVLNPIAAPGALIYNRVAGENVNIPVSGLGSLANAIVKQPEYVNCQIEWFWQQFIGKDVTLSFARRAELAKTFEDVGRRTNDFVRALVSAPEFRERPTRVEHVQYEQVAPLLRRCDTCHAGQELVGDLSLGKINKYDLLDARERLNRPEGTKGKMPRNWTEWNPAELKLLKRWIDEGAVNIDGKLQLSNQDLGGN